MTREVFGLPNVQLMCYDDPIIKLGLAGSGWGLVVRFLIAYIAKGQR